MNNSNYFLGIMTAIVGLMMLLAAEPVVQVVVVVLGISAILSGGFMLAAVAPLSDDKTFKTQCYIRAAVGIVIGILCVGKALRHRNRGLFRAGRGVVPFAKLHRIHNHTNRRRRPYAGRRGHRLLGLEKPRHHRRRRYRPRRVTRRQSRPSKASTYALARPALPPK